MRLVLLWMLVSCSLAADQCKLAPPFPWTWRCDNEACVRHPADEISDGMSLSTCKLTCGADSQLWPRPTGPFSVSKTTVPFQLENINFSYQAPNAVLPLLQKAAGRFRQTLSDMVPPGGSCMSEAFGKDAATLTRIFEVLMFIDGDEQTLSLNTSEFYQLLINHTAEDEIRVIVYADTFFGARHAIETLSQLINFDDISNSLQTVTAAMISDAPTYPIRALTLDTSRNFISLAGLRRTIDAMAMNKLNTLHWHITDTHSFPIEVRSEPRMVQYGAYSPRKVYTAGDVLDLVRYATERGVRLLPELDMPAHVGYGWQWGEKAGLGKLAVCVGKEPWQDYCVEPPCGQMNIINEELYPVLQKILAEYQELFRPDMFHMGGDEINLNCWKTTPEIYDFVNNTVGGDPNDDNEYMKLWMMYQERAYNMWSSITGRRMPVILWTSHLTEKPAAITGLDPTNYIIQIWTKGDDAQIGRLLKQGYKLILSNYDAWYLDCGFSAWVGSGNNWCSPYKSWQTVYDNSPRTIARSFQTPPSKEEQDRSRRQWRPAQQDNDNGDFSRQILGGSAALWSEQADDQTLDTKLWPRGAALAERLWSEPETTHSAAEIRLVHHRRRMVQRGIGAETMQPEYCHQYEGSCYINAS